MVEQLEKTRRHVNRGVPVDPHANVTRALNASVPVTGQKFNDPKIEQKEAGQNCVSEVGDASTINKDQSKLPRDIPASIALARIYKVVGSVLQMVLSWMELVFIVI